jgi:hypothetical protein
MRRRLVAKLDCQRGVCVNRVLVDGHFRCGLRAGTIHTGRARHQSPPQQPSLYPRTTGARNRKAHPGGAPTVRRRNRPGTPGHSKPTELSPRW